MKELRLGKGLTQAQLARQSEVREQQVIRWETERNVPSANAVAAIAAALGVDVGDFYEDGTASSDDDEDSQLLEAAHALDKAGQYGLADALRRRARQAALAAAREEVAR